MDKKYFHNNMDCETLKDTTPVADPVTVCAIKHSQKQRDMANEVMDQKQKELDAIRKDMFKEPSKNPQLKKLKLGESLREAPEKLYSLVLFKNEDDILSFKVDTDIEIEDVPGSNICYAIGTAKDLARAAKVKESDIVDNADKKMSRVKVVERKPLPDEEDLEPDKEYHDYEVEVGFADYVSVSETYTTYSLNEEEAKRDALELAAEDLSVEDVVSNGDYSYTATISFSGYIGCEEEIDIDYAEDEDDAETQALEDAVSLLEVVNVERLED